MSEHNPFAVGDHAGSGRPPGTTDPNLHPAFRELIQLLVETRPWVRLIGILMIIGSLFTLVVGAIAMSFGGRGGFGGMLSAIYLIGAILYIYPAICLMRFASAISEAESNGQMLTVNEAVLHQKNFWRFCGIVAAIIIIVYVFLFLIALVGFGM